MIYHHQAVAREAPYRAGPGLSTAPALWVAYVTWHFAAPRQVGESRINTSSTGEWTKGCASCPHSKASKFRLEDPGRGLGCPRPGRMACSSQLPCCAHLREARCTDDHAVVCGQRTLRVLRDGLPAPDVRTTLHRHDAALPARIPMSVLLVRALAATAAARPDLVDDQCWERFTLCHVKPLSSCSLRLVYSCVLKITLRG